MAKETRTTQRTALMNSKAIREYNEAIRRMACVLAVRDDEMSENEADRWIKLDDDERRVVDWGPPTEYLDRAEDWLQNERAERISKE